MADPDDTADWSLATYEGARREQLRRWGALPLREIILALEHMQAMALKLAPADAVREPRQGPAVSPADP